MGTGRRGPSPEQQAEIKKMVDRFDQDWTIDVKTKEIKRKPRKLYQKI